MFPRRLILPLLLVAVAAASSGCVQSEVRVVHRESWKKGQLVAAAPGEAMVARIRGTETWLVNSWTGAENMLSSRLEEEQVLFAGAVGETVYLTVRWHAETWGTAASSPRMLEDPPAPPYVQQLAYDMRGSTRVRYRDMTIEVVSADNQAIRFRVLDAAPAARPPQPAPDPS